MFVGTNIRRVFAVFTFKSRIRWTWAIIDVNRFFINISYDTPKLTSLFTEIELIHLIKLTQVWI